MNRIVSSRTGGPPLVLIVDRDDDTRQILSDALQHHGARVLATADGLRGLELAEAELPDVIIGDFPLDVPGRSPFTGDIRSNPELAHTRILVVTARALVHEQAAARAVADEVLVKPVDPAAVVAALRRLVELE